MCDRHLHTPRPIHPRAPLYAHVSVPARMALQYRPALDERRVKLSDFDCVEVPDSETTYRR